jgi:hypothetical protein
MKKRTSFHIWARHMLGTIFTTFGLNLRDESRSRTRAIEVGSAVAVVVVVVDLEGMNT